MDLNIYGSQIGKDKSKVQPFDNFSSDKQSKTESKFTKINQNKHNFLNLGVQGDTVWPMVKERSAAASSRSSNSGSSSIKCKSRGERPSNRHTREGERRGGLDTFLNLPLNDSQEVIKARRGEQCDSWLNDNDREVKDWEEISISTPKTGKSSMKSVNVIPINKCAFQQESVDGGYNIEENLESVWSEGSVRTLTPGRCSYSRDFSVDGDDRGGDDLVVVKEDVSKWNSDNAKLNQAATIIQNWYRRHHRRRKLAKAAMKRMLTEKKIEMKSKPSSIEALSNVRKSVLTNKRSPSLTNMSKAVFNSKQEDYKVNEKKLADKRIADQEIEKLKLENKIPSRPSSSRSKLSTSKQSTRTFNNSPHQNSDRKKISLNKENEKSNYNDQEKFETKESESEMNSERSTIKSEVKSKSDTSVKSVTIRSQVTTIDDIFSTIKELESVDCLTERSSIVTGSSQGGWNAITADIDKLLRPDNFKSISNLQSNTSNGLKLTNNSLDFHNKKLKKDEKSDLTQKPYKYSDTVISDSKMNDILKFLNTSQIVNDVSELEVRPTQEIPSRTWKNFDHTELEENSKHAVHEVSSKLMSMKLELEEKQRSVDMLQKALQQQRELTIRQVKETQKDMEKRINCQKEEYESALQRNHTFIDELISKNEILQEKCNKLVVEMKDKTLKADEKIKNLLDNHGIEIKKVESKHAAAEKLRREKWETEKTKMIKDMTIKGMETEIAQLIGNHKQELRKLKQYYENEILQGDERSYEKYNQQLEDLRKQLYKEKEEAVQKEHDIVKERMEFDQEMQRQIQILESQRKQLYQEITDERDRINIMATKQKTEIEKLRTQLEYKEDKVGENLKMEYKLVKDEMLKKFETETRELKLQSELEKQIWIETQNKKNMASLLAREQELKNEMKRNRDEEIEKVIHQLEEDNTQSKEELESMFNNKLKRAKDKYESEINELELSEKLTKEKYNAIRAEHMELEGEHETLKVMLRQKEKEIDDIKQMYETLHKEREHVSDIIRQEFADRLVSTEEENRKLKRDISECKAKLNHLQTTHSEELEKIQLSHQNDMTEVHNKVKEAIKRKEENMMDLRNQFQTETKQWQEKLTASEKRSDHLESLLEQQRKQLLKLK